MKEDIITAPSYVYGDQRLSIQALRRTVFDIYQKPILEVHDVNEWGIKAAIESASIVQKDLGNIPFEKILTVLSKTMTFFFDDETKYNNVAKITGSPISFIKDGTEFVKEWCKNLRPYLTHALGLHEENKIRINNTSPVLVILPGNSNQEVLYVLAQTLLSRNSAVVRPSSNGAGSYTTLEFVYALNKALDEIDDQEIEPLRSAISIINTADRNYLDSLCLDAWNYIYFGDEVTIKEITTTIRTNSYPRTTLGYGTGLSTSIVLDDFNLKNTIKSIVESIKINRGNECDSTDIIYLKEEIYDSAFHKLKKEAEKYKSGDPFDSKTIGLLEPDNVDFIIGELVKRGKIKFLNTSYELDKQLIHTSIIPLNKYETTMEYPGPIASVRSFGGFNELSYLIQKDLLDNNMTKNLVSSVYVNSEETFKKVLPLLRSHIVKHNKPSHAFNILLPHQGNYLLKELIDIVYIDE